MPCHHVKLPGGVGAIVCMDRRPAKKQKCAACGELAHVVLCDFPVAEGKTCDVRVCRQCAAHQEPDTDYCPQHAGAVEIEQPWSCRCGKRGVVRHLIAEDQAGVMAMVEEAHSIANVDCAAERGSAWLVMEKRSKAQEGLFA